MALTFENQFHGRSLLKSVISAYHSEPYRKKGPLAVEQAGNYVNQDGRASFLEIAPMHSRLQ